MPAHGAGIVVLALLAAGCDTESAARQAPKAQPSVRGRVLDVTDGDTLRVRTAGRTERVRLIGIDAPEAAAFGEPAECGGRAATRNLRRIVLTRSGRGRAVRLVRDATQARRDRYGRLLAYVDVAGGRDAGLAQVRAGWARVYVYGGVPFRRVRAYRAAEREAGEAGRGTWGRC